MEIGAKVSISLHFAKEFRCLIYLYILNYSNFILRYLARNNINQQSYNHICNCIAAWWRGRNDRRSPAEGKSGPDYCFFFSYRVWITLFSRTVHFKHYCCGGCQHIPVQEHMEILVHAYIKTPLTTLRMLALFVVKSIKLHFTTFNGEGCGRANKKLIRNFVSMYIF